MSIMCGTDFSESSCMAARAASAIAKRLSLRLELVHVIDASDADLSADAPLRTRLRAQAEELHERFGVEVEALIEPGVAEERLVELAAGRAARLLVVASVGENKKLRWLLGSVAERVAQASPIPVLVVRAGDSIEAWARGDRPLRVMVGVELTPSSKTALRWAAELCAAAPCELIVAQIAWPLEEHQRTGIPGPMPLDRLRPELEQVLLRELEQWAGESSGPTQRSFIVKPGWGRVDSHLTQLAAESSVDLLVVGTQQPTGMARLWQGSVSRGVLHNAAMNVACVPAGAADAAPAEIPV